MLSGRRDESINNIIAQLKNDGLFLQINHFFINSTNTENLHKISEYSIIMKIEETPSEVCYN